MPGIEAWDFVLALIGLLLTLLSMMFAGGRVLVNQFEKRLDLRFMVQDSARSESQKHWDSKFQSLEANAASEAKEWQRVEREIMSLKADLPVNYVRREDYIRNQSIIESKIDGLALRIENALLKGDRYG